MANPVTTIKVGSNTFECVDSTVASLASQVSSKITDLTNRSNGYYDGSSSLSVATNFDPTVDDNAKYVWSDASNWKQQADNWVSTGTSQANTFMNLYNEIHDTTHKAFRLWAESLGCSVTPLMLHADTGYINSNQIGGWDARRVLYSILNFGKNSVQFYLEGTGYTFELASVSIPTSGSGQFALLFTDTIYTASSTTFRGEQQFVCIVDNLPSGATSDLGGMVTGNELSRRSANNGTYTTVQSASYDYQTFS